MVENFIVRNGWIGRKVANKYYFFNIKDKEFAIFGTECNYQLYKDKILTNVLQTPKPDFAGVPYFSAITLTTQCNMNCPYCYVQPIEGIGMMTKTNAVAAVHALAKTTNKDLVLFAWGGEPTQNPDALLAMLEATQEYKNMKVLLITNGVINKLLIDKLLTYKNLVFQLSYDGNNSERVQKTLLSKQDSLSPMLTTLKMISGVTKRVSLRVTVTKRNVSELFNCLIPTMKSYTNRVIIEHLHTTSGRSITMKNEMPSVESYTDFVMKTVFQAENDGLHVKVLPLDQIREGGPNDNMTFLNILDDGNITVTNAIIHRTHKDFSELCIGTVKDERIEYDFRRVEILKERYLRHYSDQCKDCFARPICRGSLLRYQFIANDKIEELDRQRCMYYKDIISHWFDEIVYSINQYMLERNLYCGKIKLIPPVNKTQYPVFVMKGGFSLSFIPFHYESKKK